MRIALLAALLCLPAAAADQQREFVELPPGRYTVLLTGMLCTVCGRSVAAAWAKLPEIESATLDFDRSQILLTVRIDRTVKVALLRKTLRQAERTANLNAKYDIRSIAYRLAGK